ncbi:sigma factor-like helix-turn-helix DNA-binding protein [Modestobacter sp. VKM Ac-2984]|uniref:sigma factor-like helix-turn-helix DNA-binding protein n=1 Tax=Modestobacter sp. VKM Ac-2984 TaxID=3004138 RepID=UPI0022AADD8B|nr:sigma factor-like helix-turn-helix DNA-binding protein [Modestobacter sp. VKM Ac-2984]MCZ2815677.1 sigma factor-like helix-turn-helix DNA-binding protein [Modestobacter sp. VKM Ac-2984]
MSAGSFEEFVAAVSTASFRTAHLLTGERRAAEDLQQEALIAVHRRWDRFADRTEALTAVRRELVAAHVGRRWSRVGESFAHSPLFVGAAGVPGFAPARPDPVPQDETAAALAHLSPVERAAVVLRHGTGLPEDQAADALGASADDVRALVERALDQLGEVLGVDGTQAAARVRELAARPPAAPDGVHARVLDGERAQQRHRAGLIALAGFLVLVVLLVLVLVTG